MDIKSFDRLYPSPAHAAAADLRDRYAPKTLGTKQSAFRHNRSGTITVIVALAGALIGGLVYTLTPAVDRAAKYSISANLPAASPKAATQPIAPEPIATKPATAAHAPSAQRAAALGQSSSAPETVRISPASRGSSKWIADPLSGDALAAALIVDKRRTVELNAEQLRLMAADRQARDTERPDDRGGDAGDRGRTTDRNSPTPSLDS